MSTNISSVGRNREEQIAYLKQLQAQRKAQANATTTSYIDTTNISQTTNQYAQMFANDVASNSCTDGVDDGQIGTLSKAANIAQGVGKSALNMVTTALQPKNWLKTALTIGACCIPVVGPVVGGALACYGIYSGGKQIYNAAKLANSATTDAEAKAAWENIGGGAFTTGLSVVGLKGSASALKNQLGGGSTTVNAYKNGQNSTKEIFENAAKETGDNAMNVLKGAYDKAKKAGEKVQEVKANGVKKSISDTVESGKNWVQDKITDKTGTKRTAKAQKNLTDKAAQAKFDAEKAKLDKQYGISEDGTKLSAEAQKQYNVELEKLRTELRDTQKAAKKTYKETTKKPVDAVATERLETYKKALGKNNEVELPNNGGTLKKVKGGYEVTKDNTTILYDLKGAEVSTTVASTPDRTVTSEKTTMYAKDGKTVTEQKFGEDEVWTETSKSSTGESGATYETHELKGTSGTATTYSKTKTVNIDGNTIKISTVDGKTTYYLNGSDVTSSITDKLYCDLASSKLVNEVITIPGTNIKIQGNELTNILSAIKASQLDE